MKSKLLILPIIVLLVISCKNLDSFREEEVIESTNESIEKDFLNAETVDLSNEFSEELSKKGLVNELKSIGIIELSSKISGPDSLILDKTKLTAEGKISERRVRELSRCKRIIKRPNKIKITINGLDIYLRGKRIVGVGKLDVSQETLQAITESYAILDQLQYVYCSDIRNQYLVDPVNIEMIKYLTDKRQEVIMKFIEVHTLLKSNANKLNADSDIQKGVERIVEK